MPGWRALTLAPTVWEQAGQLHARTSTFLQVPTLGSFARHVIVDRKAGWVTITHRRFSLTRKRLIPFRHVHRIAYEFHRTITSIAVRGGEIGSGDEVGVGLGTPQLADRHGQNWICSACRRPGPPRPGRCYYGGAQLQVAES